jgi:NodT family efflux transporter outer membrane factor (OMF) lipoprotein
MTTPHRQGWCWILAGCCAALAGCIPTPPGGTPREANTEMPDTFGGESPADPAAGADASAAAVPPAEEPDSGTVDWHDFFGDPQLAALVDVAVANNQELNMAVQEMIVANSEIMARRGDIFPSLSAGVGAGLDRVGRYTSTGQADETSHVPRDVQDYSIGLYASWEIDIWGRLRDTADASMHRYFASAEGRHFMITQLVAEVANRYYELLALDRQLQILNDNIALQQNALEMMRVQQQAARVTMLAVTRFEAQLRGFQSRVFEVQQQIVATENQINFLLGRFPQPIERSTADFLAITPPAVHAGVPTRLLENRPDIRQAEQQLTASQLSVSAARARFYPALRLDAGVGVRSFDITQLVTTPESIFYNLLAGITAPLLNRSGITADYFAANAQQMEAVIRYERTILSAFMDVSTGLSRVRNLDRAYALRTEQVARLEESVALSSELFNAARAEYLEVLTTRRDYLEAQMDLVDTKQRQLSATVTLYQALGGGWQMHDPTPDPEPMGAQP